MRQHTHPLASSTTGTERAIVSFHYGPTGDDHNGGRKVYVQAGLHADEIPGMLVAVKLRERLQALEEADRLAAEIVVVPVANPIGLAQWVDGSHIGRFELNARENFNRHYPDIADAVVERIAGRLTTDEAANRDLIRAAMREAIAATPAVGELASLRKTLMALSADADVVLDLHCDSEAEVHLYCGTPLWPRVEPLARYLGAVATLLETESGDFPFDEACFRTWYLLRQRFPDRPIPLGCVSVTVELRGQTDVDHAAAARDADAIVAYLTARGDVRGVAPPPPALPGEATPLAGSETLVAPSPGVVVFLRAVGETVAAGDPVIDLVHPVTGETDTLRATVAGMLYARENRRYAHAGMRLCKIAGRVPFRTGKLLSE